MKKLLVLSVILTFTIICTNVSYAIETNSENYETIKETAENTYYNDILENSEIIKEDVNSKIIKSNNKYAIYYKKTNTFLFKPVIESIEPLSENEKEFKIKIKNLLGYVNTETGSNFLIKCDDLSLADKYIKVKNDGKYGLLDKNGNTILQPIYQQLSVINENGNEYFSAKYEGKRKLFYTTGKLIPDNKLYTITYDSSYLIAKDLRPEFINYNKNNKTIYENAKYDDNYVYEIKEVASKSKNNKELKSEQSTVKISNKEYIMEVNGDKIGLNTPDEKVIVPATYMTIDFKKPCKHFSKEVIIANDGKNTTVYDLKGNILAEETPEKINIYKNRRVYFYSKDKNNWNLYINNKQIGKLELMENGYKFSRTAIHLHKLHKVNELLLSIISSK